MIRNSSKTKSSNDSSVSFRKLLGNANHHNKKPSSSTLTMKVEEVDPCWLVMMIP